MIDLDAAGRRLAAARLGPTPPLRALEERRARRARRARRRRLIAAGSVTLAAAVAILLVAGLTHNASRTPRVVSAPSPSPVSGVTLPSAPTVAGSTPYDYLRLRLWLPSGWTTSTSSCHSTDEVVYFPANFSGGPQSACSTQEPAATVVVRPFDGSLVGRPRTMMINGVAVSVIRGGARSATWDVPSLGVQLLVTGRSGQTVAESLGASPLQQILTRSFPVPVPTAWQTVAFDGFEVKVPRSWPTHRIVTTRKGNTVSIRGLPPGVCSPPVFRVPSVYLGANPGLSCPAIFETSEPPTDDGLWLQTSTNRAPLSAQLGSADPHSTQDPARLVEIGAAQALIFVGSGDSIDVEIDDGGRRTDAVIGLGANPAVAEAILSSITPNRSH